jgi:hypothetical protein
VGPQPPGQDREIEHQRGVGEDQLAEVDGHIGLRADRAGQRPPAGSLRTTVLVAAAAQDGGLVVKVDDCRNLPKAPGVNQGGGAKVA